MVLPELVRYEEQLIDVDGLSEKACEAEKEKDDLKSKLELLEKKVQVNFMMEYNFFCYEIG